MIIAAIFNIPPLHTAPTTSALKNVEKLSFVGILTNFIGIGTILNNIPAIVVPSIPIRIPPLIRKATKTVVKTSPKAASIA